MLFFPLMHSIWRLQGSDLRYASWDSKLCASGSCWPCSLLTPALVASAAVDVTTTAITTPVQPTYRPSR